MVDNVAVIKLGASQSVAPFVVQASNGSTLASIGTLGDITATSITNNISTQKIRISKAGTLQGTRHQINLIEGNNITLTVSDNGGSDRVDVTIDSTAGGGSVTSVALTMPADFSIAGSPINVSGTLAVTYATQTTNKVFAAPDGSTGVPSFRILTAADIPNLDAAKITTGTLDNARTTGTDANTPSTLILRGSSGEFDCGDIEAADIISDSLDTGAITATSITDNISTQKINITKAAAGGGTRKQLNFIEGSNVSLTVSDDGGNDRVNVTIAATAGAGTVTSVGLSLPAEFDVTNSPVTSSGTLTATYANQTTNKVFAAPNGSTGTPTFRVLAAADIPNLDAAKITTGTLDNARTTGTSSNTNSTLILRGASGEFSAGAITATSITDNISTQKVNITKAAAGGGTRKQLNFIEGTNVTLTVSDDGGNDRVNVTINAAGSGSVTSVGLSLPAEFSVTNSPVTTSGTLTATYANQTTNKVFAAPNGSTGTPTFRVLVAADIPNLDAAKITTGTLDNARTTGTSSNTVSTLVLRGASGEFSAGAITASSITDNISTQKLIVSKAGTTTGTRKQINFIEGTNVTITTSDNGGSDRVDVTIATSTGTVSSVGLSMPSDFSVANSPVTSTGTLAVTYASQSANRVLASPNGSSGTPTFRALVATDIPNLDTSKITTGTLANARTTATSANTASAIVARDASGDFIARYITLQRVVSASGTSVESGTAGNATALSVLSGDGGDGLSAGAMQDASGGDAGDLTLAAGRGGDAVQEGFGDPVDGGDGGDLRLRAGRAGVGIGGTDGVGGKIILNDNKIEIDTEIWGFTNQSTPAITVRNSGGNDGYVGIYTTSPTSELDVNGTITSTDLITGAITATSITSNISTQKVIVSKAGTTTGTRKQINFIEGSNVTLTMADDGGNDRVNVTIAATASAGTVTSVGLSLPAEFSVTNSPVTTSGTLTATYANQTTNKVFAAPNGSTGTPTFRVLALADLPSGVALTGSANSFTVFNNVFSGTNTATSGTVTFLSITPTYNQASGTAANTDLLINRTETAIGSGTQLLIDAQVATVSKFSVSRTGAVTGGDASFGVTTVDSLVTDTGGITILDGQAIVSSATTTGIKIGGASDKLGFFNATPVAKQGATVDLRTALINLGFYTTGGASPLNLNGGALTTTGTASFGATTVDSLTTDTGGITILDGQSIVSSATTTGIKIGGASDKLGFFNATPVAKQGSTTDIKDVLVNLGFLTDGGATPLNLDAGTLTAGIAVISSSTGTLTFSGATAAVIQASAGGVGLTISTAAGGPSGGIALSTGTGSGGNSGAITLSTGNAVSNNSGNITLNVGSAGSTAGSVQIQSNGTNRIQTNGTGIGFFNATPVAKQGSTTDIKDVLVNLGFLTDSGATPLNLDGGAITTTGTASFGATTVDSLTTDTGGITILDGQSIVSSATTTGIKIGGASDKLGFFNATPVAKQGSTTDIKDVLVNLGFLTDSGATPLNLDGGALTTTGTTSLGATTVDSLTTDTGGITILDGQAIVSSATTTGIKIGGASDKLGFFNATPVAKQGSTIDLRVALINLGFYTTGGASPLDLNGGTLTSGSVSTGAITATSITDNISTQKLQIAKAGSVIGTRRRINLIEGNNISITVSDNGGLDTVDVTVATAVAGTVTSVGLSMPSDFSVANSPVTSTGTLTVTYATQTTNKVLAAPNGSTGTPTFRTLESADIPHSLGALTVDSLTTDTGGIVILDGQAIVSSATTTGIKIGGASDKLGFFDATPVAKQGSTTDIKDALVNLGFLTNGGATPLNLDGGALTTSGTASFGATTVDSLTTDTGGIVILDGQSIVSSATTTGIKIGGASDKLGFFNATPVAKQGSTTDIKDALVNLGFLTDSGATPLNLDTGTLTSPDIASAAAMVVRSAVSSLLTIRPGFSTSAWIVLSDNSYSGSGSHFAIKAITGTVTKTSGSFVGLAVTPTYNETSGSASNVDLLINRTETAVGSGTQTNFEIRRSNVPKFQIYSADTLTTVKTANGSAGTTTSALTVSSGAGGDGDGMIIDPQNGGDGALLTLSAGNGGLGVNGGAGGAGGSVYINAGIPGGGDGAGPAGAVIVNSDESAGIDFIVKTSSNDEMLRVDGSNHRVYIGTGGGSATLSVNGSFSATKAALATGTITTSQPAVDATQTWNASGVTFTGIKLNVTNTASQSASLLIDLQLGGSSQFSVTRGGLMTSGSISTGAITATSITDNISTQRIIVSKAGSTTGTRKQINFIEGSNVTITTADDAGNDRVNVTIASSGGGGGSPGGSNTQFQYNNSSSFGGTTGFTWDSTNQTVTLASASLTSDVAALSITPTWNASGVTFTGIELNVTNTASQSASLLIDLQVGGSSQFSVTRGGLVTSGSLTISGTASLGVTTVDSLVTDTGGITILDGQAIVSSATTTGIRIGGASDKLGFFNATPVAKQGSTTDLRTALINLGFYTTGGASPLNLNGGALTTTGTASLGVTTVDSLVTDTGGITILDGQAIVSSATTTGIKIGGASDKLGFFDATPVAKQGSTTDLRTALINLGFYTTGGASPLNLNGGALTAAGITATSITDNISTQRVIVSKAGTTTGTRKQINLIEGTNVTLTMADDAGNDRVNVTIASSGGGATNLDGLSDVVITSVATWDRLQYTGSNWVNVKTTKIPCATASTSGSAVTPDASAADQINISASANFTVNAPSNPPSGSNVSQRYIIRVKNTSGGDITVTLATGSNAFRFGQDISALIATPAGMTDYIGVTWNSDDSRWDVTSYVRQY